MNDNISALPGLSLTGLLGFIAKVDLSKISPAIKAFMDLILLIHDRKYLEAVAQLDILVKLISGLIPASDQHEVAGTPLDLAS